MNKPVIILSGVNLYLGGTLRIMQDCIRAISAYSKGRYRIVALVHDTDLFETHNDVEYIAFPKSRKSWVHRFYYEYAGFKKLSEKYRPLLWFSLHDTTPSVRADVRAVYCHHVAPFYKGKLGLKTFREDRHFFLFCKLYRYLYGINIKANDYVVVQQEWLRDAFKGMFGVKRVVVAPPERNSGKIVSPDKYGSKEEKKEVCFIYPSVPRTYKNFELLGDAALLLVKEGMENFKVYMTLSGNENRYARRLYERYKDVPQIVFTGFLSGKQIKEYYVQSDCLIFPSRIETWGLPVSEFMDYGKPVLVADCPYAHETAGGYDRVKFFDPDDAAGLAGCMQSFMEGRLEYDRTKEVEYMPPYAADWNSLFELLLNKKELTVT